MTTTILLIIVGVIIVGIAVFSWWFENVGDGTTEQISAKDSERTEEEK